MIQTITQNIFHQKKGNRAMEKKAQNEITQNKDLKDSKNKQLRRAILLPIHPNYLLYILKGKKTLEIRNTCPKEWLDYLHSDGERPEDIDVYLYCTKKAPEMAIEGIPANGRVVAKFTLRKIWAYINGARWKDGKPGKHDDYLLDAICTRACLKEDDLWAYSPDLAFYAWFVEDVELLEKPLELSHFGVNVAPQTWRYIYA